MDNNPHFGRAKTSTIAIAIVIVILMSGIVVATTVVDLSTFPNNKTVSDENNSDVPSSSPTTIRTTVTQQKTDSASSTPSSTPTSVSVDTESPTISKTESKGDKLHKEARNSRDYRRALYEDYMSKYNGSLDNSSVNVSEYTVDPKNESATIYWIQNPGNQTSHILNRQSALSIYAASAEVIRQSENATAEAVPKRMHFSIHSPEGELYMLTYIDYLTAFKYSEGTMSVFDYQAAYEANAEYGPAHPEYEENQTATAASA
jgi:hypothetical protein